MRIIVYGCGQLAASAVRDLTAEAEEITVIGWDQNRLERLTDAPTGVEERLAHAGKVSAELLTAPAIQDYLLSAGVSHADAFLALSDDDHENLLVAQIAKHIFNVPNVVCHVEDPQLHLMYTRLGLQVLGYSRGMLQDIRQIIDA